MSGYGIPQRTPVLHSGKRVEGVRCTAAELARAG